MPPCQELWRTPGHTARLLYTQLNIISHTSFQLAIDAANDPILGDDHRRRDKPKASIVKLGRFH